MVRALFCIALIACRSNSARGPVDSRPPVSIADAAEAFDATPLVDGAAPMDASVRDGATLIDAAALPDGAPLLDARPLADAAVATDATPLDAAVDAGSTTTPNTVSCYSVGSPATTCTLPTHCCFSNYDYQHQGECTDAACTWGTISCDGPEDCASGQRCCAHVIIDPDQGIQGYTLACQSDPCGPAPANEELCHPGTCSSGTCVSALGHDNDLPRTLDICQ